jgi:aspartate aminotransferase
MFNEKMHRLGSNRSVIRELFEFGKQLAAKEGADKVYDFSLGNPSVPAPAVVKESIQKQIDLPNSTALHGYSSAQGDPDVRKAIAAHIEKFHNVAVSPDLIYLTVGAAAALCITLRALKEDGDNFVCFAPFFPEYTVFTEATGATLRVAEMKSDCKMNLQAAAKLIDEKTKGVIINSPNNPSGAVYSEEEIKALCVLLGNKEKEYGHPIFLISDEPYREIVYDGIKVPYLMNYYDDVVVCYSYSKSLSLPGERIGYIAIDPKATMAQELYYAVCGAGRVLGYVCAPHLFQRILLDCVDAPADVEAYDKNRKLLYSSLTEIGYDCIKPQGAFYLMVRTPEPDANAFSERAKQFGLLLVPGDTFGAPGFVRISYCVSYDMIVRSLPAFKALFATYGK